MKKFNLSLSEVEFINKLRIMPDNMLRHASYSYKKDDLNTHEVMIMLEIIRSATFKKEFGNIGGYDIIDIRKIVAEI